jgi:hypothetical protein
MMRRSKRSAEKTMSSLLGDRGLRKCGNGGRPNRVSSIGISKEKAVSPGTKEPGIGSDRLTLPHV